MCAQAQDQDALDAAEMTYFGAPGKLPYAFVSPSGAVYLGFDQDPDGLTVVSTDLSAVVYLGGEYLEPIARWFEQVAPIIRDRRKAYAERQNERG